MPFGGGKGRPGISKVGKGIWKVWVGKGIWKVWLGSGVQPGGGQLFPVCWGLGVVWGRVFGALFVVAVTVLR